MGVVKFICTKRLLKNCDFKDLLLLNIQFPSLIVLVSLSSQTSGIVNVRELKCTKTQLFLGTSAS
jgi:hypothetical protein